jgi:hypothetical protein
MSVGRRFRPLLAAQKVLEIQSFHIDPLSAPEAFRVLREEAADDSNRLRCSQVSKRIIFFVFYIGHPMLSSMQRFVEAPGRGAQSGGVRRHVVRRD